MYTYEELETVYVFTCEDVLYYSEPILYIYHADDGNWLYLCGRNHAGEDAPCVFLKVIVRIDPSVALLADLPLGKQAKRASKNDPWEIF